MNKKAGKSEDSLDKNTKVEEKTDDDVKVIKKRKPLMPKKRSRDEKIEKVMEKFVIAISTALNSSDEKFEEKRMKLDEMMFKMEQDRIRENEAREECRRKEDRELQLKLFSALSGSMATVHPVMIPPSYYYSPDSTGSAFSHDPMYDWLDS